MQTTRHCHFAVTNLSARTYVNDALCFYAKLPFYIFLSFSIPPFILSSLSHSGSLYFCSLQYLYVPICLLTFLSVCASVAIVLLLLLLLFRLKIFLATFSDETDLRWRSSRYLFSYLLTCRPITLFCCRNSSPPFTIEKTIFSAKSFCEIRNVKDAHILRRICCLIAWRFSRRLPSLSSSSPTRCVQSTSFKRGTKVTK